MNTWRDDPITDKQKQLEWFEEVMGEIKDLIPKRKQNFSDHRLRTEKCFRGEKRRF